MTTYKVGYFVGSLAKGSINRQARQGAGPARAAGTRDDARSRSGTCRSTATTTTPTTRRSPRPSRRRSPRSTPSCSSRPSTTARSRAGSRTRSTGPAARTARTPSRASHRRSSAPRRARSAPRSRQQHLRSILAFCNSPLMNSIEAYIQFKPGLITDDGEVTDASTEEFLRNYMEEFAVSSRASIRCCRGTRRRPSLPQVRR